MKYKYTMTMFLMIDGETFEEIPVSVIASNADEALKIARFLSHQDSDNEIIIYTGDNGQPVIQVRIEGETVWLNQAQLVELFNSSKSNVSEHIKNIFTEGELQPNSVVRKFRTTATELVLNNYISIEVVE